MNLFSFRKGEINDKDEKQREEEVWFPQPAASDHPLLWQVEKGAAPSLSYNG